MRPLSALLERFRRTAGVPASVGGELEAELEPVFAALESIEREAAELRERVAAQAGLRLERAHEEGARLELALLQRSEAEQERLEAEVRRRAAEEAEAILAGAEREAEAVLERGRARIPSLVEAVVACVREGG